MALTNSRATVLGLGFAAGGDGFRELLRESLRYAQPGASALNLALVRVPAKLATALCPWPHWTSLRY